MRCEARPTRCRNPTFSTGCKPWRRRASLSRFNWVTYLSPRFDDVHYLQRIRTSAPKSGSLAGRLPSAMVDSDLPARSGRSARDIGRDLGRQWRISSNGSKPAAHAGRAIRHWGRCTITISASGVLDQTVSGELAWRDRVSTGGDREADDRTKREITRFALAVGPPDDRRSIRSGT
jgi:hypothetical protein